MPIEDIKTFRELAYYKPKTKDELRLWVKNMLGFNLSAHHVCENHCSQLDYVWDAWTRVFTSSVFIAGRTCGKSYCAAVTDFLDAWFFPGIKIAVAAYQQSQSNYILQYLLDFLEHFVEKTGLENIYVFQQKTGIQSSPTITFSNGSEIKFFSGAKSTAGIKGWHGEVLQIDEADLFTDAQFAGISLALQGSDNSRFDILSTNYSLNGDGTIIKTLEKYELFNKTRPAHIKPKAVYRICLLDVLEKCDDRYDCGTCQLWNYCKGKAKDGNGFYSIGNAIGKLIDTSVKSFESQMMLLSPTNEISYFDNWSVKNLCDPDSLLIPNMIAFDPGGARCPHGCVIGHKTEDGRYYILDAYQWMGHLEAGINKIKYYYPGITSCRCFCDPAGAAKDNPMEYSHVKELYRLGFRPKTKQFKRRETFEQIYALVEAASGERRLFVNKKGKLGGCQQLVRQICAAEHRVHKGGRLDPEPADKSGDDLLDPLRYMVGWTIRDKGATPRKSFGWI